MIKSLKIDMLNSCRICDSQRMHNFLHLPAMPLTDEFIPRERIGHEFLHDIDIAVCEDCLTVQTQYNVDLGDYYENYQYAVGTFPTANRFMRLLAQNLLAKYYPDTRQLKVLEIGSGDGEQLIAFKELGCDVLGFEPSATLAGIARGKGISTISGLFTAESVATLPAEWKNVDVIILSYTFDHLPDPRKFIAAASSILNPHGLLVVEVHNLERIFDRREYCLFAHEHSIYLTTSTAVGLCAKEGITVIDFDLLPEEERRANSLIYVATPRNSELEKRFPALTGSVSADFKRINFYDEQAALIHNGIENLNAFVERVTFSGKTIAGYGAGGRGVMSLAAMNSAVKLQCLVDKHPKGSNLYVPKCGIPLVGIDRLREVPADEIIVFSFGYMREIQRDLFEMGYKPTQLHSLVDVLSAAPE